MNSTMLTGVDSLFTNLLRQIDYLLNILTETVLLLPA